MPAHRPRLCERHRRQTSRRTRGGRCWCPRTTRAGRGNDPRRRRVRGRRPRGRRRRAPSLRPTR
eukprot:scaffold39138_cov56-Phaeocystis_antarctica.AAC.2